MRREEERGLGITEPSRSLRLFYIQKVISREVREGAKEREGGWPASVFYSRRPSTLQR